MIVDDYRLVSKLKNNRILSAIEDAGFANVNAFCKATGLSPTVVGDYINMKKSPLLIRGVGWTKQATNLAKALNMFPEELFSEFQRELKLKRNVAEQTFTQAQIEALTGNDPVALLENEQRDRFVHDALEILSPRTKRIMEMRFGLDGGGARTLEEIGDTFDISKDRVRQIEWKALWSLEHKAKSRDLLAQVRDGDDN